MLPQVGREVMRRKPGILEKHTYWGRVWHPSDVLGPRLKFFLEGIEKLKENKLSLIEHI